MRKFFLYLVAALFLCVLLIFIILRFSPKTYVSVANYFLSETIEVNQLDVEFFPLNVSLDSLDIKNVEGDSFFNLKEAVLSTQISGWIQGKNNFWKASVSGVDLDLPKLPSTQSAEGEEATSQGAPINVHQVLSLLNVNAGQINIKIDEQQSLLVNILKTQLNDEDLSDFKLVEQGVSFSVDYFNAEQENTFLHLEGQLQSRYENGVSLINVMVSELDVSSFLSFSDDEAEAVQPVEQVSDVIEEAMDWSWMSLVDPLNVTFDLNKLILSDKSSLNAVNASLILDERVGFDAELGVNWLDASEFQFQDSVVLSGQFSSLSKITTGADLDAQLSIETSALTLMARGKVNANGIAGNELLLDVNATQLPLTLKLDAQTALLIKQYFPIVVNANVNTQNDLFDFVINKAGFGESDVAGAVGLALLDDGSKINVQLESKLLSYKSVSEPKEGVLQELPVRQADEASVDTEKVVVKDAGGERVFNDEAIDWSWLDGLLLGFNWKAERVLFGDVEVNKLALPISISGGALAVDGFSVDVAQGNLTSDLTLTKKGDAALLNMDLKGAGIVLEKLNFLPPEELKGGVTGIDIALETQGVSSKQLAESLNGAIKLNVGDGVIGNDSFELIGSDLILNLLNKLNPFSKSDKTTKLECAVVNLSVENGKIDVDKSLALKTSKLTMVADGYVDLPSEKIKLSLTPKARQGVGVDVSSLVKFIALGGTLSKPAPAVTASGVLKSAVVVGAAVSTGGVSLLATSVAEKTVGNVDVCERAAKAFN